MTKAIVFDNKGYRAPEKVHTLDPKEGRISTTFYAQGEGDAAKPAATGGAN